MFSYELYVIVYINSQRTTSTTTFAYYFLNFPHILDNIVANITLYYTTDLVAYIIPNSVLNI